jgi:hypothetical protein
MPLTRVAELAGVNYDTLANYTYSKQLRPRAARKSTMHPVIKTLMENCSEAERATDAKLGRFTVENWKSSKRAPSFANVVRVAAAQGLVVGLASKGLLIDVLDKVNELRRENLSGPEVCGAVTDLLLDALEMDPK